MLSRLLVLIAIVVGSPAVVLAKSSGCVNNGTTLAGANVIGTGFDAVTATLRQPIFAYSTKNPSTWSTPGGRCTYTVPRDLTPAEPVQPAINMSTATSFFHSFSAYFDQTTVSIWGSVSFEGSKKEPFQLGVKASAGWTRVKASMSEKTVALAVSQVKRQYYHLTGPDFIGAPLSAAFMSNFKTLPDNITTDTDRIIYKAFVCAYGTHFYTSGTFGGTVDVNTFVNNSFFEKFSYSQTLFQVNLEFEHKLLNISSKLGYNNTHFKFNQQFLNKSYSDITYFGGDPSLQTNHTLDAWYDSLDEHTGLIHGTLVRIQDLLPFLTHQSKRAAMVAFIKEYAEAGKNIC